MEVMQASQPAAISTSCGRLPAFTRRFVFAIAHLSKRRDADGERIDEAVEFAVWQRPVHIAISLG